MNDTIFVPKSFSNRETWKKLFEQWLAMLSSYEQENTQPFDAAYWYGERPLTGLLGAATWKLGGWSLEEFGTGRHKKRGKRKTRSGRGDLWLSLEGHRATIEAKIHWPDKTFSDALKRLDEHPTKAKKQLHELSSECRTENAFSVCYVVPWFRDAGKSKNRGKDVLNRLAAKLKKDGKLATALHLTSGPAEEKGRLYPGVLLVMREEKWPKGG